MLQSALRRTHFLNYVNAAITPCIRMRDRFVYAVEQPPDDWADRKGTVSLCGKVVEFVFDDTPLPTLLCAGNHIIAVDTLT